MKKLILTTTALITSASLVFSADPPSFKDADKNGDGKVDKSEFAACDKGRKGTETTDQMFTKTDSDKDGSISAQEFAPYRIRREMAPKDDKGKKKKKKDKTSK